MLCQCSTVASVPSLCNVPGGARLVQVAEYQLYGNVQSMDKVELAQSKRESLLLAFKDAKV